MVEFSPNYQDSAHSWSQAKRLARQRGYGEKVKVLKTSEPFLPPEFQESILAIPAGASAVYRDQNVRDSFQIREFDDYWTIELDHHNPDKGNAIAHAVIDAPLYSASAVIAATYLGGLWG